MRTIALVMVSVFAGTTCLYGTNYYVARYVPEEYHESRRDPETGALIFKLQYADYGNTPSVISVLYVVADVEGNGYELRKFRDGLITLNVIRGNMPEGTDPYQLYEAIEVMFYRGILLQD